MSDALSAVLRAAQAVESGLRQEIGVAEMAAAAGYSLYHFVRTFDRLVRHTPYDYLIRRRLSEAALELARSDKKIIDLALEYVFHSPEVFSRAFKRMFGVQPSEYRALGNLDPRFLLAPCSLAYLRHLNRPDFRPPQQITLPALSLAGLMTRLPAASARRDLPALWSALRQELAAQPHLVPPGEIPPPSTLTASSCHFYGVQSYPAGWQAAGPFYLAAVAVDAPTAVCPPLVVLSLPASACARFHHPGSLQALPLTRDYIYQTWLPKSGLRLAGDMVLEDYGAIFPPDSPGDASLSLCLPLEK